MMMKIENIIEHLKEEYAQAITEERIIKPLAYALYQTWRYVDNHEKPRKREAGDLGG